MKDVNDIVLDAMQEMSDNKVPTYEGIFAMVAHATHCALDLAPNQSVAMRTVLAGVDEGLRRFQEEQD